MSSINVKYSLMLFFSAIISLGGALYFEIQNPYWAVMPVWILVQSSREEIIEKGFWRIGGTILGALLSISIVIMIKSIFWKLVLISLILGVTSGFNHAFKGLNGYGLQMLGLTIGAIVLPILFDESRVLPLASARVTCTILGVIVVSLLTYWYLPKSPKDKLYSELLAFHESLKENKEETHQLLKNLVHLEEKYHLIINTFLDKDPRLKYKHYCSDSLLYLLNRKKDMPEVFSDKSSRRRIGINLNYSLHPMISFREGMIISFVGLIGSLIGVYSGWRFGHLMAMAFCILSAVLGGMSISKKMAPHMLTGVVLGALTAALYRMFLQPHMTNAIDILLWTAPIFLVGAMLRTHSKFKLASVDFNMIFLLAGQIGMNPIHSKWDAIESTFPILIAGLVVTSLYSYLPRPYFKWAQKYKVSLASKSDPKDYFKYLSLLKMSGEDDENYKKFILDNKI